VSGLDNKLLTTDAGTYTGVDVKISQRKDSGIFSSPDLKADNVTFYKVSGYVAKQEKIVYLGYNGTSGNLENNTFIPGTEYEIKIKKLGLLDHYEDAYPSHKMFGYFNASATSGEAVLARGLVKNGVANFSNDIDGFVRIEMVTGCAASAASLACSFIEGSKLVTATGAGHGISACDYIKINDDTYYVESVDGALIYLEVPYQRTSCTVTPSIVTDPTSAGWGIKFTGKEKKFDSGNLKFRYDVSDFNIFTTNFDNTTRTYAQSANIGTGTWEEVCQLEWEVQDYEGQTSHTDYLSPSRKRYFETGKNYDILVLRAYDNREEQITGTPKSPFTVFVAIPTGCTQGDAAGSSTVTPGVATALDLWMTTNTSKTYNEDANLT